MTRAATLMLRRVHTLPVSLLRHRPSTSTKRLDHLHKALQNIMLPTAHEIACALGTLIESGTRSAKSPGVRWDQKCQLEPDQSVRAQDTSRSNWLKRLELHR